MITIAAKTEKGTPCRYAQIRDFLAESSSIYPGIEIWWENQVLPGLQTGERICRLTTINDEIAAIGIGKKGQKSAKLCTLRVRDSFRGSGLGQRMLVDTLCDLLEVECKSVHFTISEEICPDSLGFFTKYGFGLASWSRGKYVKGLDELAFAASAKRIRTSLWLNRVVSRIKGNLPTPKRDICISQLRIFNSWTNSIDKYTSESRTVIACPKIRLKSSLYDCPPSPRFIGPLINTA